MVVSSLAQNQDDIAKDNGEMKSPIAEAHPLVAALKEAWFNATGSAEIDLPILESFLKALTEKEIEKGNNSGLQTLSLGQGAQSNEINLFLNDFNDEIVAAGIPISGSEDCTSTLSTENNTNGEATRDELFNIVKTLRPLVKEYMTMKESVNKWKSDYDAVVEQNRALHDEVLHLRETDVAIRRDARVEKLTLHCKKYRYRSAYYETRFYQKKTSVAPLKRRVAMLMEEKNKLEDQVTKLQEEVEDQKDRNIVLVTDYDNLMATVGLRRMAGFADGWRNFTLATAGLLETDSEEDAYEDLSRPVLQDVPDDLSDDASEDLFGDDELGFTMNEDHLF
ncbi:hypothetical protein L228DRAFT_261850 [Xylona heveae TC161]|uniref:Uncharacterized protein n=1 Tax=Xylona heveae (strain CBS 132557 / TC161) TaxID=1328760 RepID=A0A165G3Y2_XYLHT|nr:hypothetical protein L228DRAFT_261850 [Xylona heveae TC161]KZF21710.1 hypothetical protein L228DRAFT_261850 [Xylona heveae TC161]